MGDHFQNLPTTVTVHTCILCCVFHLGDDCIQNFHLGRYLVGYTVANLVLRRRASGAVGLNVIFERISDDIPPQLNFFEYDCPHSNALLQSRSKLERCKPHKAERHPTKCDVFNYVKQFLTVYRTIR